MSPRYTILAQASGKTSLTQRPVRYLLLKQTLPSHSTPSDQPLPFLSLPDSSEQLPLSDPDGPLSLPVQPSPSSWSSLSSLSLQVRLYSIVFKGTDSEAQCRHRIPLDASECRGLGASRGCFGNGGLADKASGSSITRHKVLAEHLSLRCSVASDVKGELEDNNEGDPLRQKVETGSIITFR